MALPTYNKSNRRKSFEALPKGAYVVKILSAKEDKWPSGDGCVKFGFDIAEGQYKDFYRKQYERMRQSSEDAVWPYDAVFTLNVPSDTTQDYVQTNWDSFFADLEDSNNGFVFDGDLRKLTNKVIGGKFRIKQTEGKTPDESGNFPIYDHTELYWTCVAEDVRSGNAGRMPNDKLIDRKSGSQNSGSSGNDGFMNIPDDAGSEIPFPFN